MTKPRELSQQNFEAIRNQLFDRIHKTGEEMKNDFPNKLRCAIETEAWRHFSDAEGKPFENLVDWLAYTFPNGASMGEGRDAITYEEALQLCQGHPEVHRVLAGNAPKRKAGQKKSNGEIAPVRVQFDRHTSTARKALLEVKLREQRPDVYEKWLSREFKSLRTAAEAAGLIKPANNPLPRLKSFWNRASKKDQRAFLKWITVQGGK